MINHCWSGREEHHGKKEVVVGGGGGEAVKRGAERMNHMIKER